MKQAIFEDIERCVRCGSCKAFCPTYEKDLTEAMSARGRLVLLGGLERGELEPSRELNDRITSCLLCGMCEASCPVGVRITEAVYHGRSRLVPTDRKAKAMRKLMRLALMRPRMGFRAARAARFLLPYLHGKGTLPFDITLPAEPLRNGPKVYKTERARGRAVVFTGCSVNYLFPSLGASLVHLLLRMGYEVVMPAGEVCCGAPLRAMGLEEDARSLARRNIEVFGKLNAEAVLSLCPTCTLSLKSHYPELAGQGVPNAQDATEFLAGRMELLFGRNGSPSAPEFIRGPVAYHDPCHLRDGLGVREEPRALLRSMGLKIIEPRSANCCGMSLAFTHREISEWLLKDRAAAYGRAETLITACPGCMLQLSRGNRGVLHVVEALDEALSQDHGLAGDAS